MNTIQYLTSEALNRYADELTNNGCNDWYFPSSITQEEREEFLAGYAAWMGEQDPPIQDWLIVQYLAHLAKTS